MLLIYDLMFGDVLGGLFTGINCDNCSSGAFNDFDNSRNYVECLYQGNGLQLL